MKEHKEDYIIVDDHVHMFSSGETAAKIITSFNKVYNIQFENSGPGTIDDLLSKMNTFGINYSILANFAPAKIIHANNLWCINCSQAHNGLIPLVSFHPDMEGVLPKMLEEYILKGAKGIKLHTMAQNFDPGSTRLHEVYRICNELHFPIEFHCGRVSNARLNNFADIDMILPVIDKYPDIPFVLTHMAGGNIRDIMKIFRNYGNVFFDTSIVISGYLPLLEVNIPSWKDDKTIIDVINEAGANRILFGSDYPWGSPGHDLIRIKNLALSEHQKKLILGINALKLFNIT